MITEGSVVRFEYTVSDEKGEVLQSNRGQEPVTYTHGQHEIIPGLEKALSEMDINEEKTIRVRPEEAYGRLDPKGFKEVPKSDIPISDPKVGTPLNARGPQGEDALIHIREVKQDTVILDFNHPLAGKTLKFDVKVVDIEQAPH
ncbi:MAG TPA: peptidylprolyl isomerase [Candidatus Binatia bacterium]|nr:peptidylprolyl isomerase [Candidatus Binatia bacterium]